MQNTLVKYLIVLEGEILYVFFQSLTAFRSRILTLEKEKEKERETYKKSLTELEKGELTRCITHCPLGDKAIILNMQICNIC